jgi:exosortase/archaeosortase family protein
MIGYIFLFTAIFNIRFVKEFSNDLFKIAYLFAIFLVIRVIIGKFWIYLSTIIFYALSIILPVLSNNVSTDPSLLKVSMENFTVTIGAPCSGIYSLMTFFFLFTISVILLAQKNKLDYLKTSIALITGLIIVFLLNILRVSIIIFIGAYYSADLAMELFHEYLSAIFLIALFIVYLYLIFPRILKK